MIQTRHPNVFVMHSPFLLAVVSSSSLAFAYQDRVEASPEQLSRCAAAAEQFTQQGGVRTRVIGWYHSHPHITVLPSHVDIKTQAAYQMLDDGFVGLIFSTFDEARIWLILAYVYLTFTTWVPYATNACFSLSIWGLITRPMLICW